MCIECLVSFYQQKPKIKTENKSALYLIRRMVYFIFTTKYYNIINTNAIEIYVMLKY